MSVELIFWYWISPANYWGIYVSWKGSAPGPNCPGPNCPLLKNGQLGPGQLGPGPNCPGPNCPPLKNGQLGPGQLGPGPNCPGPNCPPQKNRQLGPGQLGPRHVYYPWTQKLPQVFGTNIRIKSRMLICTNILDNGPSPQLFGTKIRIKSRMLNCTHLLEIVPSPLRARQGPKTTIQLDNSPKCLAKKSG